MKGGDETTKLETRPPTAWANRGRGWARLGWFVEMRERSGVEMRETKRVLR